MAHLTHRKVAKRGEMFNQEKFLNATQATSWIKRNTNKDLVDTHGVAWYWSGSSICCECGNMFIIPGRIPYDRKFRKQKIPAQPKPSGECLQVNRYLLGYEQLTATSPKVEGPPTRAGLIGPGFTASHDEL